VAEGDGAAISRLAGGRPVLGRDGCGRVVEIGANVVHVNVGDRVWFGTVNGGTMADFALLDKNGSKPLPFRNGHPVSSQK